MPASDLVETLTGAADAVTLPDAARWMQGRTLYGGASTLVAYIAAIRAHPRLPQLRSGQVAFVAPVGATLTPRVTIVREGRNVVQVRSELLVEGKVALNAFFQFGAARAPNAAFAATPPADWPGAPEDNPALMPGTAPAFLAENYEVRRADAASRDARPALRRWVRLREEPGLDPLAHALLVGDTLPPAAIRAMERPGPLSSVNWSFNVVNPAPALRDGWFLAENASEWADHGYSSERLQLRDSDGALVLSGQQSVAIFG